MPSELPKPPDVVCNGLRKVFGHGAQQVEALASTDVTFASGTTTALVGPSGCGKSTLLRMVAGLETPTEGSVLIAGESPRMTSKKGTLSVAFQDPSLLPWRTVRSNVALARKLAGQPADKIAVDDLIARVGLAGFEDKRPAALSGGITVLVTHSVSEAVLLSDRILVLSARPATIVADIDVALERPRTARMIDSAAFRLIEHEVSEILFDNKGTGKRVAAE